MDKTLLRKATLNSGLLAFTFLNIAAQSFAAGSLVFGTIAALATYFTVKDAISMHNASKAQ